jgi:hypothetical protein
MENSSLLVVVAVPAICISYFARSLQLNKKATVERDSANSLVVLSGMLAALAILIPLGTTLLPEKRFTWQAWLLVGALLTGVLCIFGTIYSMVKLQDKKAFVPKDFPYIPSWINATWLALTLIALGSVAIKSMPAAGTEGAASAGVTTQARFVVARDLPELGASRQAIETKWGSPGLEKDSELLYQTMGGVIVFCLNAQGVAESITEAKEVGTDAVRTYCR